MRDPALHIRRSDLRNILKGLGMDHGRVDEIFREARPHQIRTRSIMQASTKERAKRAKVTQAKCPLTTERFSRILYAERVRHKHTTITPIRQGDSSWSVLNEVARDAYEFGEQFDISPRDEAYRQYVNIGLDMMKRAYLLTKFKYLKERIYAYMATERLVDLDPDTEATDRFAQVWYDAMERYSKVVFDLSKQDVALIIHSRTEAEEQGADYTDWVEAQFDQLAFMDVVPNLNQFHGDGAIKRYRNYMLRNARTPKDKEVSLPAHGGTGNAGMDAYYAALLKTTKNAGQ